MKYQSNNGSNIHLTFRTSFITNLHKQECINMVTSRSKEKFLYVYMEQLYFAIPC